MKAIPSRFKVGGLHVAAQTWSSASPAPASSTASTTSNNILCLHGWLDNSNSFSRLAPYLVNSLGGNTQVVAVDLIGHGFSSHWPGSFPFVQHVGIVAEILDSLGWEAQSTSLLGHSMGGGISMLFAGTYPERLRRVVLLDAFGPFTSKAERAPTDLRKFLDTKAWARVGLGEEGGPPSNKLYKTLQDGISARVRIVSTYPGEQTISPEAAEAIVRRGAKYCPGAAVADECSLLPEIGLDETGNLEIATDAGPIQFRYDSRLLLPSPTYLTQQQVEGFCAAITCPILVVRAEKGWPINATDYEARKKLLEEKGLLTLVELPGSHHLHLDPETSDSVGACVFDFFTSTSTSK